MALAVGLAAIMSTSAANAGQVLADGTVKTVDANASYTDETPFEALNKGVINTNGAVVLTVDTAGGTGAFASQGGQINLNGGSITAKNGTILVSGVETLSAGSLITANNANIIVGNGGAAVSWGARALGGQIIINGGSITSGDSLTSNTNIGVESTLAGSSIQMTDVAVQTKGSSSQGVLARISGTIQLSGGSVTTLGNNSAALQVDGGASATGLGGSIFAQNTTIATFGKNSFGLNATTGGTIAISGSNISTSGNGAAGLFVGGNLIFDRSNPYGVFHDASINATNLTVITNGDSAHAASVAEGGILNVADSSLIANGAGASALSAHLGLIDGTAAGDPATVNLTSTTLSSQNGASIDLTGFGVANIKLTNSRTPLNSGAWLNVESNPANPPRDAKPLTGNITLDNAQVTGSVLTAKTGISNIMLQNGSLWTMTGNSNVTNLVNDPSAIIFSPPSGDPTQFASYKTLTVGNYTGAGGAIQLNTHLTGDGSPTDRLVVTGDTSGATNVKVINRGGLGAQTVEGIKIIDIGGASNGTFQLVGDYVFQGQQAVAAGVYSYTLQKNGVSTPKDGDWYLRSGLTASSATPPPVITSPVLPPLYQPGIPLYEAYAQTLLGLNGLPTLQQRAGNHYWLGAGNAAIAQGDGPGTPEAEPLPSDGGTTRVDGRGIWTRIEGTHVDVEPKNSTSGTDYKYDIWKLQSGLDGKLYESDEGTLIGGITVHYGNVSADISSVYGEGTINTNGYGFGGTLTWYGQNGFYLDGQAQATWFDSDLTSETAARRMADGNNGFGYAFSLEAGKRIAMGQNWTLTPQAQLSYSAVNFDSFTDPFNANVSLDSGDSLRGRLGISADYQSAWSDRTGKMVRTNVYGVANLYYEFLNGTQVDVSTVKFVSGNERFWGGVGAGGSYNWADDKYSVYGEVSINTSLASFGDSYSLNGTTGFRLKW